MAPVPRSLDDAGMPPALDTEEAMPGPGIRIAQFAALVLTALALIPVGAHLAELPVKIDMAEDAYFTVQAIYSGWSRWGVALIGAIVANLVLTIALRRQRWASLFALAAFALTGLTLAIFFAVIYPTNVATANWTIVPTDWEGLRRRWEYGHAVNAGLTFLGFCAVALATLRTRG
ncbi:MAG: DUF1772 domain-containing protein [Alphaproteobacteria bacterium]